MSEKKRKPKLGAPRTEVFAMRLDPKLKYLAEIAARKQRRSLANFVEWAIEHALTRVRLVEQELDSRSETVAEAAWKLWALDDVGRLIKLAANYPDLLSYDEQVVWQVISEHSAYNKKMKRVIRFKQNNIVDEDLVRNCWQEIKGYIMNTGTKEDLDAALCQHDSIPT